MPALIFNKSNLSTESLLSKQPVVVYFGAKWCAPCAILAPAMDTLAHEYEGRAKVGKVDADTNQVMMQTYGVNSLPTTIVFDQGAIVLRIVGVQGMYLKTIRDTLNKILSRRTT